ncbi:MULTISPECIES: hypothetical protein [Flagellimonas]|uniref:Uncharacterized protein n=1 Tax=Flagellimonas olearia TaxID=552546 RepID=A0A444VI60_9FLAO|nr:hypothetical protein [Allomuricauda olearia]RYC50434.1 hypothetical protein DN53_05820 [Allomuricauda olearia]
MDPSKQYVCSLYVKLKQYTRYASYLIIAQVEDIPKTVENQIGKALKSIREQVKDHIFTFFLLTRKWMGLA